MLLQTIREKFQSLGGGGTVTKIIDTKCRTNQDFRKAITIVLSNPAKKNAMTPKMMVEFANIVDELENDKTTSVVLLQGEGGFFCSGADLSFVTKKNSDFGADMCRLMQDTTSRFRRLGQISIAVIDGGAIGGGTELASMCDFRCMETKAKFQAIHAARSLSPGWGGASRLSQIIGRKNAIILSASAKAYNVEECKALGLVDHIYSASDKESSIEKFYEPFIEHNIQSIHAIKKSIAVSTDFGYTEGLKIEAQEFQKLWSNLR